jgi:hypothetical protein
MYTCHGLLLKINANAATKLDRPMTLSQYSNAIRGRRPREYQQNRATLLNLLLLLLKDKMGRAPKEQAEERKLSGKRPLPRTKLKWDLKRATKNTFYVYVLTDAHVR